MRRRVTIDDVAAAAGVSRQTVTRAMNDMAEISASTRTRVLEAARELHYRPSRHGRGLVKGDQPTIGLVVHDLTNPYFPELASAVVGAATVRGWHVVLADTIHSHDRLADMITLVGQVDVVVGYPAIGQNETERLFEDVPLVRIGSEPGSARAGVELDLTAAMADLAAHLSQQQVRRPVALMPGIDDVRGLLFAEHMAQHGLDVTQVSTGGDQLEETVTAVRELLTGTTPPDVILAFNDRMACWAMKALARAGVRVPDDVRVVGVDGLSLGEIVTPELTTLAVDMVEVAAAAIEIAVELVEKEGAGRPASRRVEHRLLLRASA